MSTPAPFSVVTATADIKDLPAPDAPYYVLGRSGAKGDQPRLYIHKQTTLGRVLVRMETAPTSVPEMANGYYWADVPKLPAALVSEILAFFQHVFATKGAEAAVLLTMDDDDQWGVVVPDQIVDHTSVSYDSSRSHFPEDEILMGSIHSHCDFSSFHSGTDEADSARNDGLHITMGHVDTTPDYDVMVAFSGLQWKTSVTMADVIDGDILPLSFPPEWLTHVTTEPPRTTVATSTTTAYSGYTIWDGDEQDYEYEVKYERWLREEASRHPFKKLAPPKNIGGGMPGWMSERLDQYYSLDPDRVRDEIDHDMKRLQAVAATRGLRFNWKTTRAHDTERGQTGAFDLKATMTAHHAGQHRAARDPRCPSCQRK